MLTQSTQLGCSYAWVLVGLHPKSQIGAVYAHAEATQVLRWRRGAVPLRTLLWGGAPLCTPRVYVLAQGAHQKTGFFSPKSALRIWWFSHFWTVFWESCFSSKWNRLWCKNTSIALKRLNHDMNYSVMRCPNACIYLPKNMTAVMY